jgi:hypothetical protein
MKKKIKKGFAIASQSGVKGTLKWMLNGISWELKKVNPTFRARLKEHLSFDEKYGVETLTPVFPESLDIPYTTETEPGWYEAAEPWIVREIIKKAPVEPAQTTFVDIGAGKGRVMCIAALHGFQSVVGIELSSSLAAIARSNIAKLSSNLPTSSTQLTITIIEANAAECHYPDGDLLVTFFNPFGPLVLQKVLTNLLISHTPRKVVAAYINPVHHEVFEQSSRWSLREIHSRYRLYESV